MTYEAGGAWTTTWPRRLCLVLGVVLSAGCASSTPNPFVEGVGSLRGRQITVWVRSANRNAMEVTLLGNNGQRVQLGRVDGVQSVTFSVQWRDRSIRALIEMGAGRPFTTRSVSLTSQKSVFIDINSRLRRSSISAN